MTILEDQLAALKVEGTIAFVKSDCPRALSFGHVRDSIFAVIPKHPTDCKIIQRNTVLHYAPPHLVAEIAACRSGMLNYPQEEEYAACTQRTRAYLGWLARVGLGAVAIGEIAYQILDGTGREIVKHNAPVCVDSNRKVYIFEPMDATARDPLTYYAPGSWPTARSKLAIQLIF